MQMVKSLPSEGNADSTSIQPPTLITASHVASQSSVAVDTGKTRESPAPSNGTCTALLISRANAGSLTLFYVGHQKEEDDPPLIRSQEGAPVSAESLVSEATDIYCGLIKVEWKCYEEVSKKYEALELASGLPMLSHEQW